KKIKRLKREKKSNQRNFDEEEEQDLNESANTSVLCCGPTRAQEAIDFLQPFESFLPPITKARKEPEISESVAEFVVISNSATMENLDLLFLQQNESYLDEYRECFSDVE
ncbi:15826_t:CDS:2, partial [Gigaspora rosea]